MDEEYQRLQTAQYENFMIWSNLGCHQRETRKRKMIPYSIQQLQLNEIGGILLEEGSEGIINDCEGSPSNFLEKDPLLQQQIS